MCSVNFECVKSNSFSSVYKNNAPSFKGSSVNAVADVIDEFNISLFNRRYIQRTSHLIEDMWTQIRKGELLSESPHFAIAPKKEAVGILRPVYNKNNELLLEISDGRYQERFYLDREKYKYFRYEKSVATDYGSATLKYFDSRIQKNKNIAEYVNEKLSKYFLELFPPVPRTRYADKFFTRSELDI